jgi:hypothetical protein
MLLFKILKIITYLDNNIFCGYDKIPRFQDSKIPRFQDSKIPRFQDSKIPDSRFHVLQPLSSAESII